MAGLSYPFDSGPGSEITEDQWSYLYKDAVGTGVHENGGPGPNSNELLMFTLGEPGLAYVYPGRATINGFHYQQSATESVTITANANVTLDRMDALVLRLDLSTNAISLAVKVGVPSATPFQPAIASNEMILARFIVAKNSSAASSIDDKRWFVGRRMFVTDQGASGSEGDIQYSPFFERWMGVLSGGGNETFAFTSELDAHVAAADPHPQYLTSSEGFVTSVTGSLTRDANVSNFGSYCRALVFPGGYKLVHVYAYGQFNGATDQNGYILYTIDQPSLRPSVSSRHAGHQWKFANSSDDVPLIIRVNATGSIQADITNLMGGAQFIFNCMYFVGTGV